jgi:hypothetical protein
VTVPATILAPVIVPVTVNPPFIVLIKGVALIVDELSMCIVPVRVRLDPLN